MKLVLLGASAGGLEPLEKFFETVPVDTDMTFVVVQHLAPDHKSLMHELLSRRTSLPIHTVEDGLALEKGHIYLNTSKEMVLFQKDHVSLRNRKSKELDFPINRSFKSAAQNFEENCAGIVLSGTGSDGSEGLKAVKERGGFTMVENPKEAKFSGMPNSAIRTKSVDIVEDVSTMYRRLVGFFGLSNRGESGIGDELMDKIIAILRERANSDFSGYKRSTIIRRIERRMAIKDKTSIQSYFDLLKKEREEIFYLSKDLLIGVTRLFRDLNAFESLEADVFPELIARAKENERDIRIWVAGCSTGEEAYTLAILLHRFLKKHGESYDVTIFATDVDNNAIKEAGNKVFSRSIVDDVPSDILQEYFIAKDGGFAPAGFLRKMIVFSVHNLIEDPPFSKIDLASCRNLLIYLNANVQDQIIYSFRYSLRQGGYLFLGASETLGAYQSKFEEIDRKWKIYKNSHHITFPEKVHFKGRSEKLDDIEPASSNITISGRKSNVNTLQESIIQQFLPGAIIFNDNLEIVHIIGYAEKVVRLKRGAISNNITHLLPDDWSVPIEVGFSKVKKSESAVQLNNLTGPEGESFNIVIDFLKHQHQPTDKHFVLTLHNAKEETQPKEVLNLSIDNSDKVKLLESELRSSKENLQTTIEELESSNEELQAANEELQSSNEELESLNEELYTVNSEYQQKVQELSTANNDLKNLINNTDIAILFLSEDLKIRNFTKAIAKVLNIEKSDEGRRITDFAGKINFADHEGKIKQVLESLKPQETTIETLDGDVYIIKINPFVTTKNEIKGVIIALSDITQLTQTKGNLASALESSKRLSSELEEKQRNYQLITEHSKDLICLHNEKGDFTFLSPSVESITGYTQSDLLGESLLNYVHPSDLKGAKSIQDLLSVRSHAGNFFRFKHKGGEYIWLNSAAELINDEDNRLLLLTSSRDVSENMELLGRVRSYETIIKNSLSSIIITDTDGLVTFMNDAAKINTGYSEDEMLGQKPGDLLQNEDTNKKDIRDISVALKEKKPIRKKLLNTTKEGNRYWVEALIQPFFGDNGEHEGFFSVQQNVTEDVESRLKQMALNKKLNKSNAKLQLANEQLEDFAYVISHDLKEPARGVAGLMEMLASKKQELDGGERKIVNMAQQASTRMVNMIDSILTYSRTGRPKESRTNVSFNKILDSAKKALAHKSLEADATYELPEKDKKIWVYPHTFSVLIQNLLSNAIKYRSEKPLKIKVSIEENENEHIISVADNGQGIAKEDQDQIFKIFNRVTEKKKDESHGIGLATCKRIAELHGGSIQIKSKLKEGSKFIVAIEKHNAREKENQSLS